MLETKKNILLNNLRFNDLLQCPICGKSFSVFDNIVKCENLHCFDISKYGYLTLLKSSRLKIDHHYDKELFKNRRQIIINNFFKPIENEIVKYINNLTHQSLNLLDLGCGEGSIAYRIQEQLKKDSNMVLLDYSKNAIKMCTDYVDKIRCPIVADMSFLPIKNESIDVVLNFLSPINPKEIKRIVKKDGIVIKIIPTKNYLFEFRKIIEKDYSNDVESNLKKSFNILEIKTLKYEYDLNKDTLKNLLEMTPLMFNYREQNLEINTITVELKMLVMKIKD